METANNPRLSIEQKISYCSRLRAVVREGIYGREQDGVALEGRIGSGTGYRGITTLRTEGMLLAGHSVVAEPIGWTE